MGVTMKIRKIMMVSLILLAILTIGAVSASESAEMLSVDGSDDLSINESSEDVVTSDEGESQLEVSSDENSLGVFEQDVNIDVRDWSFSTTEADDENSVICIEVSPYSNGAVVVSSGNKEFFNKELNVIENRFYDEFRGVGGCNINNDDLNFFSGLSSEDIVKVSFLSANSQTFSNYCKIYFEGDSFRLENVFNVWNWNSEWDGPLYLDTNKNVVDINIQDPRITGTFYVTANGREYKYVPHFDEWGNAWHNWKLTSFDITEAGLYPVTIEYANDTNSPREILRKGVLDVVEFNHDAFRVIVDTNNNINLYCPDNHEGTVSIFLKNDWGAEYPDQPVITYEITANDYNKWKSWNFEELGCEKENEYIFRMVVNNGTQEVFSYDDESFWYGDSWDVEITPAIALEIWGGHYDNGNNDDDVFAIYIPEKSNVYNGTIEIKNGGTVVFSKVISTGIMDFDDNSRDYRYWVKYNDVKSKLINLKNNAVLTVNFRYNNTQVSQPFVTIKIINKKNYEIELEQAFDAGIFSEGWGCGPLYLDYNSNVVNLDIHSSVVTGVFYVTANGIEYKYEPFFNDEGNAGHNWILSSFNITEAGSYPVTMEYAKDDASQRSTILQGALNVVEFNYDTFRISESRPNQSFSIYCPEGSEGSVISLYLKDDWEKDYPAKPIKTIEIKSEHYNQWLNLTYNDLGLKTDRENIVLIKILNGNVEMLNPYETSVWYDGEPYEPFMPDGLSLIINRDDFRAENEEDTIVDLYVPETTFIYGGTLSITSNGNKIYSKVLSLKNMDFDDEGRYYKFEVPFGALNLKNLRSGDIVSFAFTNDVKNITKLLFYKIENRGDEEEPDECVNFNFVKFTDANFLRDETVIEICDLPDGVDDEFTVVIDRWGDFTVNTTWKISELARNQEGLYTLNCSALKYELLMDDMTDVSFDMQVKFYRNGSEDYTFEGNPWIYKNPYLHSGEIANGEEDMSVISFFHIPEYYEDEFIVKVTNGDITSPIAFKLSEMGKHTVGDEDYTEYWLKLKDLRITENGIYDITIEFRENNKIVSYNSTISVVDFVVHSRSNIEQITDAVFRIMLPENATGGVVLSVNDTEVFNNTLSYIGYRNWNRMPGYNIPLNYLQINESGNYSVKLQVYDDNGNLLRTINHDLDILVAENVIRFADLMYAYGEDDFLYLSQLTHPLPVDGVLVLYLNGTKAGTCKISCDGFGFPDLDSSFVDEFGYLKAGLYNAKIELVNGENNVTLAEGSFRVWEINGTDASVPANALTIDNVYVSLSAPKPAENVADNARILIYIDPYNTEWDFECDNIVEIYGRDLDEFYDNGVYKINVGRLSAGSHNLLVQYVIDYYDGQARYMDYEFLSKLYKTTVKKSTTKITVKALKTTYNSGKYLIATLKDQKGNLIKNTWVTVKISGGASKKAVTKRIKTNNKGQIKYLASALKVSSKYYTVKFTFAANSLYSGTSASAKVKINKASPVLKPTVKKYAAKTKIKKYAVTVTTAKNPLKSVKVALKVNGKTLTAKTNSKGVATFKVTKLTKKGTYKAIAALKGTANYKKAIKSFKIVVK